VKDVEKNVLKDNFKMRGRSLDGGRAHTGMSSRAAEMDETAASY
jgi:hypothetical protein